ncbi:hypothetical protein ASG89_24440 [Paenibacillus sp. Soil766]|uniref:hypothetical protein n=1 Tax=Paenibacillus sp. Soil766 TaxID=1736404 RepID=UPI00070E16BF|nr:hypothetical protein [Paenibacillus sp. Soil766]KRF02424.1 hypothetical protein ASG89_24440 [Paenibacillus sp. Soil766]
MLAKHATHLRSKRKEPSTGTSHSFIQHAGNQIRQVILLGEGIVHWTTLAKHATHLRSKRQEPSAGTSHSFIQHAGNQIRQVIILGKEQK